MKYHRVSILHNSGDFKYSCLSSIAIYTLLSASSKAVPIILTQQVSEHAVRSPKKRRKVHFCSEHIEGPICFNITTCVGLNVNGLHRHIIFNA